MIRRFTAFMFGMVIAICGGLAMLPKTHGAVPPHINGVMATIIGIDASGKIVGAKILGFPDTMAECSEITRQARAMIPQMTPPVGVTLITACISLRADNSTSTTS